MGSLERCLENLEVQADVRREDERATASCKVLARLSTLELRAYVNVLRRMKDGESPGEEYGPILRRVEELYEEVSNEH